MCHSTYVRCTKGTQCVRMLIHKGADVNTKDKEGKTALLKASENGAIHCLDLLIQSGAVVNEYTESGTTALTIAAKNGHSQCLDLLLKAGADVNGKDAPRNTALNKAFEFKQTECIEVLLHAEADVNIANNKSITPLIYSAQNDYSNFIKALLEAGANVNFSDIYGRTATMYAAKNGNKNMLLLLCHVGADVNMASDFGYTAIMFAAENNMVACVDCLIEAGASVNHVNKAGETALSLSVLNGCEADMNSEGATVNVNSIDSECHSSLSLISSLLKAGAYVNVVNKDGRSILTRHIIQFGSKSSAVRHLQLVLLAAGETIDGTTISAASSRDGRRRMAVPEYLQAELESKDLMSVCRVTIRKRLRSLSPVNLFVRTPLLKLPSSLTRYLLYDIGL